MPTIYKCVIAFVLVYSMISAGIYILKEHKPTQEYKFTEVFDSKRILQIVRSY